MSVSERSTPSGARSGTALGLLRHSRGSQEVSVIGPRLRVVGELTSPHEIRVDGVVEGNIRSPRVTIGPRGVVDGTILADTVRIGGCFFGRLEATTVMVEKTAEVDGMLIHHHLTVEPGAVMKGLRPWRPLGSFYGSSRRR
jgi:cytoskeletal protein CcmA (bactofilin family)